MTVTDHALRVIEVYPVSSLLLKFLVYACTHAPCTMQPHDSDSSCVQPRTTVAVQQYVVPVTVTTFPFVNGCGSHAVPALRRRAAAPGSVVLIRY